MMCAAFSPICNRAEIYGEHRQECLCYLMLTSIRRGRTVPAFFLLREVAGYCFAQIPALGDNSILECASRRARGHTRCAANEYRDRAKANTLRARRTASLRCLLSPRGCFLTCGQIACACDRKPLRRRSLRRRRERAFLAASAW